MKLSNLVQLAMIAALTKSIVLAVVHIALATKLLSSRAKKHNLSIINATKMTPTNDSNYSSHIKVVELL